MKSDTKFAVGVCLFIAGFFWYAGFVAAVLVTGQWHTEVHGWAYPLGITVPTLGMFITGGALMIRALYDD